jgi:hypothetical protein
MCSECKNQVKKIVSVKCLKKEVTVHSKENTNHWKYVLIIVDFQSI